MPARTPEDCDHLLGEYLSSGSVDDILTLYEANAIFVTQDRQRLSGHGALREVMTAFAGARPKLHPNLILVARQGDDLAIIYNDWTLTAAGADGATGEQSGRAIEVIRRQADGTWKFAFDDPFARSTA
jgi:uncharacterized protein (TIGR02246 family)